MPWPVSNARRASLDLDRQTAVELAALLARVGVGEPLPTTPYADLFTTLEYLLPALLRRDHPEWKHESLDGLSLARAVRSAQRSAEFLGTCILITDQTVTPFALEVTLGSEPEIESLRLRLGEPGGGQLGISGPPCNSGAASTLRMLLPDRIDDVDWSFTATW